jgi:hypothetical protein
MLIRRFVLVSDPPGEGMSTCIYSTLCTYFGKRKDGG